MNIAINMGVHPIFVIVKGNEVLCVDQKGLFWQEKNKLMSWHGTVKGKTPWKMRDRAIKHAHQTGRSIDDFIAGASLCKVLPTHSHPRIVRQITPDWIEPARVKKVAQRMMEHGEIMFPR